MDNKNELEVIASTIERIAKEFHRAALIHGEKFNSAHEGYAVLKEEVDELWDDIKKNDTAHSVEEAIQVAAMAIKYVLTVEIGK